MPDINTIYLVIAVLIFISILTSTLSARLGMPLLLFFLGVGMLAGDEGILGIKFEQYVLANFIGQAALACILLDGGLRTSIASFRVGLKPAIVLATWGVFATVVILGVFATYLLKVDWRLGLLIAAIVGSTDAAAVFSLLRNGGIKLNDRVQATLEIESGANDPLAILLVTVLIALNLDPQAMGTVDMLKMLVMQIIIGLSMGLVFGKILAKLLPKIRLAEGMYAILIMSAGFCVFASTNLLNGSGFLAVYIAGIIIGNTRVRATEHVLRVMDSFAWLSQAILFVILGLLVTPSKLIDVWHYSLVLFLGLLFIARPFAVASSLAPFKFSVREIAFIAWVGLRGAVPITLAIMPVMMNVAYADLAFNIAFGIVILSLLVQGASIPQMARLFKVWVPATDEPKDRHQIWVSDKASITLYEYTVKDGAFAIGRNPRYISSKMQDEIDVFALVRDGKLIDDNTALRYGDSVWYAMQNTHSKALAKIFNNSSVQYQKNSEFYGEWLLSPSSKIADLPFFVARANLQNAYDIIRLAQSGMDMDETLAQSLAPFLTNTVGDIMRTHLSKPVKGDAVRLSAHWSLIVRDIDADGQILSIGLKRSKDE